MTDTTPTTPEPTQLPDQADAELADTELADAELADAVASVEATEATANTDDIASAPAEPAQPAAPTPKPGPVPSPSALARPRPQAPAAPATPTITTDHSASAAFGRVDESGTVFVRTPEGEKEVGSYPEASHDEALTYFARKYDELDAHADLLATRAANPDVASKDIAEGLKSLRAQVSETSMVGDLPALDAKLEQIHTLVTAKRETENVARDQARAKAAAEREVIVAEAEKIAAQPQHKVQWKTSGARMRELLDEWKAHQKGSVRLDKESENALWTRFSSARNTFDKGRKAYFAQLDATHAEAKGEKERLVKEAEALATSKDWAPTAGAFKRLMDQWRQAGRASRTDDEALWARFKAAQDSFFAAKDEVVAAEEEQFRGNLAVKEELLKEAEALLPVTDVEKGKAALRGIQDRWDAAGKVPRADMARIEGALRRVEQAFRDVDEKKWKSSNPELAARSSSFVQQLEKAVADLTSDLEKARAKGDERQIKKAEEALAARQAWLESARAGAAEFGG